MLLLPLPPIRSCWIDPNTYTVRYDGETLTSWISLGPSTTGFDVFTFYPTVQAFYKGGRGGSTKSIVTGNMGSPQSWMLS